MNAAQQLQLREHKDRAAKLIAKGKLSGALEALQAALLIDSHDLALHQKKAEVLARLGRNAEAIRAYQHVVGGWAGEGLLLRAIAICKVILQLDASHTETQRALAELYARQRGGKTTEVPAAIGAELSAKRSDSGALQTPVTAPVVEGSLLEDAASETEVELDIAVDAAKVEVEPPPVAPIPVLSELGPKAFQAVLEGVELVSFAPDEVIVREGDRDESMFALVQGKVRVLRGEQEVAELAEGAFFGEMALVAGAPRFATVQAQGEVVALIFTAEEMNRIAEEHPSVARALESYCRERLLENLLRQSPLFAPLSQKEREALAESFKPRSYEKGAKIIERGRKADGFHVILRGSCKVRDDAGGEFPALHEGDVFGEISLLRNEPATATVQAQTPVTVLRLSAAAFVAQVLGNRQVSGALRKLGAERLARKAALAPLPV